MHSLLFLVQGSSKAPYKVTFQKHDNNLSAYCTCPAGDNGQFCKHRINILEGSTEGIVSDNEDAVKIVSQWLLGTDVEAALNAFIDAEKQFENAKQNLSATKKRLAATFRH